MEWPAWHRAVRQALQAPAADESTSCPGNGHRLGKTGTNASTPAEPAPACLLGSATASLPDPAHHKGARLLLPGAEAPRIYERSYILFANKRRLGVRGASCRTSNTPAPRSLGHEAPRIRGGKTGTHAYWLLQSGVFGTGDMPSWLMGTIAKSCAWHSRVSV